MVVASVRRAPADARRYAAPGFQPRLGYHHLSHEYSARIEPSRAPETIYNARKHPEKNTIKALS